MLSLRQDGLIYTNYQNHNPVLYYDPAEIDQGMSCPGLGIRGWYALNFATPGFEKIGIGLETGFHISAGRASKSVIPQDDPKGANLRFPLLLSFRRGACIDRRYYGTFGFCLAGGIELLRASIPNETGIFLLPKVEGMLNVKKLNFFVAIYPVSIKSYYMLNGERILRQSTYFYDLGFRFGLTHYKKRYRDNKKLELFE